MMKIVIYGVGLIGGSFALALKFSTLPTHIVGFGPNRQELESAVLCGAIDEIGSDENSTLYQTDLVLLATPVGQMAAILERIAPMIGPNTLISDVGSTKSNLISSAYSILGGKIAHFIPGHPIAGAENSGIHAADKDLFRGKSIVLTPVQENDNESIRKVAELWQICGGVVHELTPEEHDRIFAAVSHLPHLLSFALVSDLAERKDSDLYFTFAASGFRDFTRIAASDPEMWRDICLANKEALLVELTCYRSILDQMSAALKQQDGKVLEKLFSLARKARRNWSESRGS